MRTGSETGSVADVPKPQLIDEIGPATDDDIKARLDALRIALGNNPNAQGYIINYGSDREVAKRERQLQKAISFWELLRVA